MPATHSAAAAGLVLSEDNKLWLKQLWLAVIWFALREGNRAARREAGWVFWCLLWDSGSAPAGVLLSSLA